MGDRGFTLVEVVLSSAMLVALAAGASPAIAAAIREGHTSRLRLVATAAAAGSERNSSIFAAADIASGGDALDAAGGPADAIGSAVYERRWTTEALSGDAEVLVLDVSVRTRDGRVSAHLITVRAQR